MKRGELWDRLPPKSMTRTGRKLLAAILIVTLLTCVLGVCGTRRRELSAFACPASDRILFRADGELLTQTAPGSYVASAYAKNGACAAVMTRRGRTDTLWAATEYGVREIYTGRVSVFTVGDDGSTVFLLTGERELLRAGAAGGFTRRIASGVTDFVTSPDGGTVVYASGGALYCAKGGRSTALGRGYVPVSVSDDGQIYATDGHTGLFYLTTKTEPVRLTANMTGTRYFVTSDHSEILYEDDGDTVVGRGSVFVARFGFGRVFPAGDRRQVKGTAASVYESARDSFAQGYFLTENSAAGRVLSPGRLFWLDSGGLVHAITGEDSRLLQDPVPAGKDGCVFITGTGDLMRAVGENTEKCGGSAQQCAVSADGKTIWYLDFSSNLHAVSSRGDKALAGSMRQLAAWRNRCYCVDSGGRLYTLKGAKTPQMLLEGVSFVRGGAKCVFCFGVTDANDTSALYVSRNGTKFEQQRDRIVPQ